MENLSHDSLAHHLRKFKLYILSKNIKAAQYQLYIIQEKFGDSLMVSLCEVVSFCLGTTVFIQTRL